MGLHQLRASSERDRAPALWTDRYRELRRRGQPSYRHGIVGSASRCRRRSQQARHAQARGIAGMSQNHKTQAALPWAFMLLAIPFLAAQQSQYADLVLRGG